MKRQRTMVEQVEDGFREMEFLMDELSTLDDISSDGKLRIYSNDGGEFGIMWTEGDDLEEAGCGIELDDDDDIDSMLEEIAYDIGGLLEDDLREQMEEAMEEQKEELADLLNDAVKSKHHFTSKSVQVMIGCYGFPLLTKIATDDQTGFSWKKEASDELLEQWIAVSE